MNHEQPQPNLAAFCNGCGYYRATHSDHRPDCTRPDANRPTK